MADLLPLRPAARARAARRSRATRLDPAVLLPPELRRLRARAVAAALAAGRTLRPDTLTVVLAAKAARGEPGDHWTAAVVQDLLWLDVLAWCEARGVLLPLDVPEALFAVAEAVAGPDLGRRADLVEPLLAAGGLTASGRRRHPSGRRAG